MNTINNIPLDKLLETLEVTMSELRSPSRKRPLCDARAMLSTVFRKQYRIKQSEVALLLDTSQAAVSKMLKRHEQLMQDPVYQIKFNQVKILMSNL